MRYFTPTVEVPICGHATIAAHYARAQWLQMSETVVRQNDRGGNSDYQGHTLFWGLPDCDASWPNLF
ncbi:PhzF family phenazine biosynthesis protein [Pandoraea apista]|uniref:PhzF family phenazine biosynthesis protein n=1 Tax=Pandoraea apista TaxID=93218 RepID=UPI003CD0C8C6